MGIMIAWIAQGRSLADLFTGLGLGLPSLWMGIAGLSLTATWIGLMMWAASESISEGVRCEACRYDLLVRTAWPMWGNERPAPKIAPLVLGLAGASEELLFRGWLLWYFAAIIDGVRGTAPAAAGLSNSTTGVFAHSPAAAWGAVGLSAVVFALLHAPARRWGPVLFAAAMGTGAGVATLLIGSLWPAVLIHAGHNAVIAVIGVRLSRLPVPRADAVHVDAP